MGDRSYGYSPVAVEFLGERAVFTSGALHLAAMAGCPVVVLFSAKTGPTQYELTVAAIRRPVYEKGRPKQEQLREWVQDFARTLEAYVQRHPFQCFLFHDVWSDSCAESPSKNRAGVVAGEAFEPTTPTPRT